MSLPSKSDCFYVVEMVESRLVDYSYTQPWADELIKGINMVPGWLFKISTRSSFHEQSKAIKEYVFSEPFAQAPEDMDKFYVGCLYVRHERRELSWATFLDLTGEYLDTASCDWDCETPYHYLNITEDSYFSEESERETKRAYFNDHEIRPWAMLASSKFEPFRIRRKMKRAIGGK